MRLSLELPANSRRRGPLEQELDELLAGDLAGRVLQFFDGAAVDAAGTIAAARQRAGRTVEIRDVQIAGIASARKAALATRNVRHFEGLGIPLIDPWRQRQGLAWDRHTPILLLTVRLAIVIWSQPTSSRTARRGYRAGGWRLTKRRMTDSQSV